MRRLGQLASQLQSLGGAAQRSLLMQQTAPSLSHLYSAAAFSTSSSPDVVIVGAGHNGLVAAALLARQGLQVHVVEQKDVIGGACRTGAPAIIRTYDEVSAPVITCAHGEASIKTVSEVYELAAEYPFSKVPGLGSSTGAYLLGLFPPELLQVGSGVSMLLS